MSMIFMMNSDQPPPAKIARSEDKAREHREKNAARMREKRASMTEADRAIANERDAFRKRLQRASMTQVARRLANERKARRMRERRALMTQDERTLANLQRCIRRQSIAESRKAKPPLPSATSKSRIINNTNDKIGMVVMTCSDGSDDSCPPNESTSTVRTYLKTRISDGNSSTGDNNELGKTKSNSKESGEASKKPHVTIIYDDENEISSFGLIMECESR